jgi:hypothetical protein
LGRLHEVVEYEEQFSCLGNRLRIDVDLIEPASLEMRFNIDCALWIGAPVCGRPPRVLPSPSISRGRPRWRSCFLVQKITVFLLEISIA